MEVNKQPMKMEFDTGAIVSNLEPETAEAMQHWKLPICFEKIHTLTMSKLDILGMCQVQ